MAHFLGDRAGARNGAHLVVMTGQRRLSGANGLGSGPWKKRKRPPPWLAAEPAALRSSPCHWRNDVSVSPLNRLWPPLSVTEGGGSTNWPFTITEKCRCAPVERPLEPT